jgi:hypothetical protein
VYSNSNRNISKDNQDCIPTGNTIKMSGGVRNLRAMFENKDPADPPDRGRSPAASSMGE